MRIAGAKGFVGRLGGRTAWGGGRDGRMVVMAKELGGWFSGRAAWEGEGVGGRGVGDMSQVAQVPKGGAGSRP